MSELGRVVDPAALDAAGGAHGRMTIELAEDQLGQTIAIAVPRKLVCARCDGGGCDGCHRSGAIRLELEEEARMAELVLPEEAPNAALLVRLVRPFGDAAELEQLTIEVRLTPPAMTTALAPAPSTALATPSASPVPWRFVAIGLAIVAALFALLSK